MQNNNSKIIKIKRAKIFSQMANPELEEYYSTCIRSLGSEFVKGSTKPKTGLTHAEQFLLVPHIIDLPSTDVTFRKELEKYFLDLTVKIPAAGLPLEIGLEGDNDEKVSESNMPINVEEYVKYKWIIASSSVAPSEVDAIGNQIKKYYIVDADAVTKDNIKESEYEDNANTIYLSIKTDDKKVKRVLSNLTGSVSTVNSMSPEDRVLKLKQELKNNPKQFIKIAEDRDLEVRYILLSMLQAKLLNRVGERILITESGDKIGNDMKEAILWWSDAINSDRVGTLKARYQELSKTKN